MWALDLGTTNSCIACWDGVDERPRVTPLPGISLAPNAASPLEVPRVVPSVLVPIERPGFFARLSASPSLSRWTRWGRLAHVGAEALALAPTPRLVSGFKEALGRSPLQTVASVGGRALSARGAARLFVREVLAAAARASGSRITELAVAVPVGSYEGYRAELSALLRRLGVRRVRFVDEPVAAAIGYGLSAGRTRHVVVVDFGGGTLDLALLRLEAKALETGACTVVAKAGRALGGQHVDGWLLEHFCQRLDYPLSPAGDAEERFWHQLMLGEARRVKESVQLDREASFQLYPPDDLRRFEARLRGSTQELSVSYSEVCDLLEARGLFSALSACTDELLAGAGFTESAVDEVLMVGGSTLLPQVFALFESRFGRHRVRSWQPFEAVAYGAAIFSAGKVRTSDFILHDYALLTHSRETGKAEHTVVVPRGTRIPTAMSLWQRHLVPTCSLGEPESLFKLLICEIGRGDDQRSFGWDASGRLHQLGGGAHHDEQELIVPLNEASPTLGTLSPPHSPTDKRPRISLAFGVNAERWLCATVEDLRTGKQLMFEEPVVRLL